MRHSFRALLGNVARAQAQNLKVVGVLLGKNASRALSAEVGVVSSPHSLPVAYVELAGLPVTLSHRPDAFFLIIDFPEVSLG